MTLVPAIIIFIHVDLDVPHCSHGQLMNDCVASRSMNFGDLLINTDFLKSHYQSLAMRKECLGMPNTCRMAESSFAQVLSREGAW